MKDKSVRMTLSQGHVQQKVRKCGQVKNQLFLIMCNNMAIEGYLAMKTSREEPRTITNHMTCSKNTISVVNVVICTK